MDSILSLDTNVLVDLVNGRGLHLRQRFQATLASGQAMVTCAISAHELVFGTMISRRPDHQQGLARELLALIGVAELTFEDVEAAASLRASLRRGGNSIGSFDTFIAGQALSRGWTVVTGNVREFERVEGLKVIDWMRPPETT
jgi:tRNA(fMet)-specific endonuclease VapC